MKKPIILASGSPRRKQLLEQIGLKFKIAASDYEEDMTLKMKPLDLAKHLSRGKAEDVAKKHKNSLIIAADTFIVLGKKVLGKPHTAKTARQTLRQINNKVLRVITGLTLIDTSTNKKVCRAVETQVYIKKLSNSEINNYVKTKEPLDKAGAFGIQGLGAVLIRKIEGDYFNVMGLPLYQLVEELEKFGIRVL